MSGWSTAAQGWLSASPRPRSEVLVLGPAPVEDAEQNACIHSLSAAFAGVCAERNAPLVSVVESLPPHPTGWTMSLLGTMLTRELPGYGALADQVLNGGWLEWLCGSSDAVGAR